VINVSALRPLGALLAAMALWSVGLLVLALAGLGGNVGPHPDNDALTPPMPQVQLTTVGSRLGPVTDYLEVGNRPLLSADRRPAPITADEEGEGAAPLDVVLTSVLIAGDLKLAIVQGKEDPRSLRVRLGDVIEGTAWRLVELEPRRAVFDGPQGRTELELRVFDGTGGEAPTPALAPAPVQGRGTAPVATAPASGQPADAAGTSTAAPTAAAAPVPQDADAMTQEQQVEAIRRRIEARRAQMRAENARRNGQQVE
jgi:general secretion pathway protein N